MVMAFALVLAIASGELVVVWSWWFWRGLQPLW